MLQKELAGRLNAYQNLFNSLYVNFEKANWYFNGKILIKIFLAFHQMYQM